MFQDGPMNEYVLRCWFVYFEARRLVPSADEHADTVEMRE